MNRIVGTVNRIIVRIINKLKELNLHRIIIPHYKKSIKPKLNENQVDRYSLNSSTIDYIYIAVAYNLKALSYELSVVNKSTLY